MFRKLLYASKIPPTFQLLTRSKPGAAALARASVIFGCMDRDGARLLLNEFACAYNRPYFDIATDTDKDGDRVTFGGRLMVRTGGDACLYCMDLLDRKAVKSDLTSPERRGEEDAMYGVRRDALGERGPSLVGLNGILASIAVTEFMVFITGVPRPPKRLLRYYGSRGIVNGSLIRMQIGGRIITAHGNGHHLRG